MKSSNPFMGPLGISLLAILIILLVLSSQIPLLVSSTGTAASSGAPELNKVSNLVDSHKLAMSTDLERFNGRSFFYRPPSPPTPKPKLPSTPKKEVKELPKRPVKVDPKPVEPTYPKTYTGPDLQAIVGPTAFFKGSGGQLVIINVGETEQDIELLSTNPPHAIEVKYKKGGPYKVTLFEMEEPEFFNASLDSSSSVDIIAESRDTLESPPLLEDKSGWPAGTIAGDPVRIRYRQGPYEASITGMLTRANRAWLVITPDDSETPIEIFKADILSVQNLKPTPPPPPPAEIETDDPDVDTASNTNATIGVAVNGNATTPSDNQNASGPATVPTNANGSTQPNNNASADDTPAGGAADPAEVPESTPEEDQAKDSPKAE